MCTFVHIDTDRNDFVPENGQDGGTGHAPPSRPRPLGYLRMLTVTDEYT
ncbi:hypothetical protein SAMN05443572_111265 [Myxococcus fulvus]|uniref:Uncharacterized protein n=1 Tax=Myxococcus fulvus TaxID=33 RepID=A0A511TD08_MYXFU|nr:hypothetical protein MFU01_71060 [Myxococcus fulvus]SEU36670.1 hypothetical protein SAMN05443572_111265 [Myxococcus fulvus]